MITLTSAASTAPILRFRLSAFHHHKLLPTPSAAGKQEESRPFSSDIGAGAQTIPVQSCRLRSHARTRPLTLERAGTGQAFNRDAGGETGVRTSAVTQATNAWRRATTQFLERGNRSQAHLAEEILRFCSVDGEEACREVALHAPQSGQAMTSPRTGAVGVEQFPSLCIRRTGPVLVNEEVKAELQIREDARSNAVLPTLRTPRRVGQPQS